MFSETGFIGAFVFIYIIGFVLFHSVIKFFKENFPELKDDQFITFPSGTDVTSIYVGLDGGKITPVGMSGKVVDVSGNAIVLHGRNGSVDRLSVYQNGKYVKSLDDGEFIVGPKNSDTSVYDKLKTKLGEKVDFNKVKEIEMV